MNWINEELLDLDDESTCSHDTHGVYSWLEKAGKNLDDARLYFFEKKGW